METSSKSKRLIRPTVRDVDPSLVDTVKLTSDAALERIVQNLSAENIGLKDNCAALEGMVDELENKLENTAEALQTAKNQVLKLIVNKEHLLFRVKTLKQNNRALLSHLSSKRRGLFISRPVHAIC